jgi:hypothetical protein
VSDGSYDLRAVATDRAGYATTSESVRTYVANPAGVLLGDPGDAVRGAVALAVSVHNLPPNTTVRVESLQDGSSQWKSICTNLTAPYACTWGTTAVANDTYDLRAVATSGGSTFTSPVVTEVQVDNLAPTVTMTDPGTPLSGFRTFAATPDDDHSGVVRTVVQYAVTGTSTWKDLCTITAEPWSCRIDTATLADGSYSLRAVATDLAGNSATSTAVANRVVDNTVSSVSLEDPGANLAGTVTLRAGASSTAGVTSVRIQRAPAGTSTWTDVCTDTSSPYTCTWNTAAVSDGLYDLRAVLLDGAGRTTTSTTVASRRVDNTPLRGYDVQTVNGGSTSGRPETGDRVTFTYTDQLTLSSVTSGWDGSALAVTLRIRDGKLLGTGSNGDTLDVQRNGNAVNLGSVNLKQNYVKDNRTQTWNATMTAATTTVAGSTATTVTIQLGSIIGTNSTRRVSSSSVMVWTPSALATDVLGRASSTTATTELGSSDRDF